MLMTLSGGMKRRVLIAKALSHEPAVLFLDEPTAGVDVSLRKDMWKIVQELKGDGVTIILTTHYIEEAEEIADRVGVINQGEIIVVEDTKELLKKMGHKKLTVDLQEEIGKIKTDEDICIITGPESGFSKEEIKILSKEDIEIRLLKNNVLRAETAPIVISSLLQNHFGNI